MHRHQQYADIDQRFHVRLELFLHEPVQFRRDRHGLRVQDAVQAPFTVTKDPGERFLRKHISFFLKQFDNRPVEQTIKDNRLCLFFIKAPDCGVCNVMLDKVEKIADVFPSLCSLYTDIIEEPLIASHFLVYSGPTVLLLMDGKEVYRASQFIDLEELKYNINRYIELIGL